MARSRTSAADGPLSDTDVRVRLRDGQPIRQLCCPRCVTWADLDDDQVHGRVSIECVTPGCTFHETHDLSPLFGAQP